MKKLLLLIIVLAVAGVAAWYYLSPEVSNVKVSEGKITDIKSMVNLCTVDFYEDVPIKAKMGQRHFVGRAALTGSISFDLEKINQREQGDTLFVELPPEIVEIYESTEPNSYEVIDTWTDKMFGSSNFTNAEENKIKAKVKTDFRKTVYAKGYVKRARAEAVTNLKSMLSGLTGKTVVVTDPTPEGNIWLKRNI